MAEMIVGEGADMTIVVHTYVKRIRRLQIFKVCQDINLLRLRLHHLLLLVYHWSIGSGYPLAIA